MFIERHKKNIAIVRMMGNKKIAVITLVIVGMVLLILGYLLFPATQCEEYSYGNCPIGCQKRCIPSSCTYADSPVQMCTADCDGPGSCLAPELLS